jgi:23S rRNA (pseudouridine1915-N3)-methyltransferase
MITLLCVGRPRGALEVAIRDYEGRIPYYWKFEAIEVEAGGGGRGGSSADPEAVMAAEGTRLLGRVPPGADLWILSRDGTPLDSPGLARALANRALHSAPPLVLAIGGAFGFHASVVQRASRKLTLSAMTLPHEMARLIVAEQLYRAGTILRNEPYHKGPR